MNFLHIISITIAFLAMILSSMTVLPQLFKTLKTKLTINLSINTLLIFNFANTLWIIFAFLNICIPKLFDSHGNKVANIIWSLTLIIPYSITWTATSIIIKIKLSNMIKYHESGGNLKKINAKKVHEVLRISEDTESAHSKL